MENTLYKKAKLATAIALVSSTTLLTGCLVEGDKSTSLTTTSSSALPSNNFERVANPVGTVTGLVQDIQGNGIAGAKVSIAGRTTTTTNEGTYQFTDIPVTGVVVNTSTSAGGTPTDVLGTTMQALVVSIQPPAGYLGATVTVTAPAAVIDYGGDDNCTDSNAGSTVNCAENSNTHSFIDGFIAQAGTAVLPALNASVTGVLRNSVTGESMANTEITLEMMGTYDSAGPDGVVLPAGAMNNGAAVSYGVKNITTITDANGQFEFTGVPSKSELTPRVAGFKTLSVQDHNGQAPTTLSTNNWTTVVEVGAVMVAPIVQVADIVSPFVTRVDNVTNGVPGLFNDDVDLTSTGTGLVVHFSEPLADSVDASVLENSVEVLVWNDTGASAGDAVYDTDEFGSGNYAAISALTLSADRTSMTVTLDTNLTEGQSVHVNMLAIDFTDTAGNPLTINPAVTMSYDSAITGSSVNNGNFIRLGISTFVEINKGAPAVTSVQGTEDTTGIDTFEALTLKNSVFTDVNDADTLISHLNATDDDGIGASEASARLNALQNAIGGGAAGVDGDQALITFTPNSAAGYIILVQDELGVNQTSYANITAITGNVIETNPANVLTGANGSLLTLSDANDVSLVLDNVEAGWAVSIIPVDDLGYGFGTPTSTTLADLVPPTTVLQTSYGVVENSDYLVTGETFGEGGELVNVGNATGKTPILNITAQLLDNLSADGTETVLAADNDNSLDKELVANNTVNATTGAPYITSAYDSAAYTAMAGAASRTMGVAFSENIASTGTPAFNGSAGLSNWTALNDVVKNDNNTVVNVDLMTFDVDSVFALAKDNGKVIDFTGTVTDTATTPNTADAGTNSRVIIRDALPPFIVSGTYNGDTVILEFNEEVVPEHGDVFTFSDGSTATISAFPDNGDTSLTNFTLANINGGTNNQLTIKKDAWGNNLNLAVAFALPAYSGSNEHGEFGFSDIRDTNGNNWASNSYGITSVPFALLAGTDPVMSIDSITATGGGTNTAIVTVNLSHRVATYVNPLTAANVGTILNFTDAGAATTANFATASGTVSPNGRTLTMTIPASSGTYNAGDNFEASGLVSDWDSSQTATAANDDI